MPRRKRRGRQAFLGILWAAAAGAVSLPAASLNLLPRPARIVETTGRFVLDETFTVAAIGEPGDRARRAAGRFLERLSGRTGLFVRRDGNPAEGEDARASLLFKCDRAGTLFPGEDESYRITVSPDRILLVAPTDLGILRGFETILQLTEGGPGGYILPCVQIEDAPRFPWRGLLIDSGRHFQPVEVIKRNIDGLAAVKMNVLHWHLTEDQGFRVESKLFPALHELGSDGQFYTQAQIRDIVVYAADRGIRVMPEFDLPGHSTSWFAAFPELASAPGPYRVSRTYGVQLPAFNPANPNVYAFLDAFLGEMAGLFPDAFLHIGGDENNGKHWDQNPEIQEFKKEKGLASNEALQAYFTTRLLEILKKHGRRMVGWDEILQPDLPKDIVIQSWRGTEALVSAARQGYIGLLSNGYYLDLCRPAGFHYLNDPLPEGHGLGREDAGRVWGGEAAMWSDGRFAGNDRFAHLAADGGHRRAAVVPGRRPRRRRYVPPPGGDRDRPRGARPDAFEKPGHDASAHGRPKARSGPLQVLAEAVEPLEGYARQSLGKVKTTLAPLTRFVDAVPPESGFVRAFQASVEAYLAGKDAAAAAALRRILERWRTNHESMKPYFLSAPGLLEVEPLSRGLSEAADIGLEAIQALVSGKRIGRARRADPLKTLAELKKPFLGELELAAVPAIETSRRGRRNNMSRKSGPEDHMNKSRFGKASVWPAAGALVALLAAPLFSQKTEKPVLHGRHWLAVTGKPMAATAGAMIFQKGGNAVDAACAMLGAVCTMWDVLSWGGETQALIYHPGPRKSSRSTGSARRPPGPLRKLTSPKASAILRRPGRYRR